MNNPYSLKYLWDNVFLTCVNGVLGVGICTAIQHYIVHKIDQWPQYSGGLNIEHWNTKHFKVWIFHGLVLEWSVIAIAMAPTILKLNHWKSKQNGSNGSRQNGRHFVQNRTPLENTTEGYHQSEIAQMVEWAIITWRTRVQDPPLPYCRMLRGCVTKK